MGRYISIRGWLACSHEQVPWIKETIQNKTTAEGSEIHHYLDGWHFPAKPINWTAYVFFGADVRRTTKDAFAELIRDLVERNSEIEGVFYLDDEEGAALLWRIQDGCFSESERTQGETG